MKNQLMNQIKAAKRFTCGVCSLVIASSLFMNASLAFAQEAETTEAETTLAESAETTAEESVQETTETETSEAETSAEEKSSQEASADSTEEAEEEKTSSDLSVKFLAEYNTEAGFDEAGTEIVDYNPSNQRIYSVNGATSSLDIIDASKVAEGQLSLIASISLPDLGVSAGDVTSVSVHPSGTYIAVAAPNEDQTENGAVVFLDAEGALLSTVEVGALPDCLTFSQDGTKLVVANEGEPSDDYANNPVGSISVISTPETAGEVAQDQVVTTEITEDLLPEDLRPLGPSEDTYLANVEPEFVTIDSKSEFAYVSLQEVSAIAKVELASGQIVQITSLGYKDHSLAENGLDTDKEDGQAVIKPQPVLGMYQPDTIDYVEIDGAGYILTANEGDSQDYDGYSEETKVKDLLEEDVIALSAENYEGFSQEELDQMMEAGLEEIAGLKVTTDHNFVVDGKHTALVSYGGRSFSIVKAEDLTMVYDSGDQIEQITLKERPDMFNADFEAANEFVMDGRSSSKGPEPETIVAGTVGEKTYAFVALERTSGVLVFDITKPEAPVYVTQFVRPADEEGNYPEIAPEGMCFVTADQSPTGKALLLIAHEVSGVISVYELEAGKAEEEKTETESTEADDAESTEAEETESTEADDAESTEAEETESTEAEEETKEDAEETSAESTEETEAEEETTEEETTKA